MTVRSVRVCARDRSTDTQIEVVAGQRLRFEATGCWTDWRTRCDADGYLRWYLRPTRALWRVPHAALFALCGSIIGATNTTFAIGRSATIEMPSSGRLMLFANDVAFMYRNNSGEITVTIEALD